MSRWSTIIGATVAFAGMVHLAAPENVGRIKDNRDPYPLDVPSRELEG